jgi:hypothetical protein
MDPPPHPSEIPIEPEPLPPQTTAPPAKPVSKWTYVVVLLLVAAAGAGWWWFHRPAPPYKVQDPGIYPYQDLSADGKAVKWGFLDADGKVIVQPQWDGVAWSSIDGRPVAFNEGLCGVQKDGKWGYIDTTGKLTIQNQFDSAGPFVEGLARVNLGNLVGYIDKTGGYAINPQFDQAGDFHGGLALAHSGGEAASAGNSLLNSLGAMTGVTGGWGFINKTGTFVIKAQFPSVDTDGFAEGLAGVCQMKCGYVDHTGNFAIKPEFESLNTFSEGRAAVRVNGKWGYIDTAGKLVVNPQFDLAASFSGGLAAVTVSGHTGTIDKQGKYVLNPGQYSLMIRDGEDQPATTADGIGLIGKDGKWIIKPTRALTGIGKVLGKVFYGTVAGQFVPITMTGKVLAGPYKGALLDTMAQDIQNETSALQSMNLLTAAEARYSAAYPAKGFADSLDKLGPPTAAADDNHAGLIDAALATGTKDGYQFVVKIPEGTSTGGTNFNYLLSAKPAAGHAGRTYCADSTATVHYALPGQECTTTPATP